MKRRTLGPRVYDWQPAPFGRVRKVPPAEAARWTGSRLGRTQAQPLRGRDAAALAALVQRWQDEGCTVAAQAHLLGVSTTTMAGLRHRLITAGLLIPRTRGRGKDWSSAEVERLVELVEAGYGTKRTPQRMLAKQYGVCQAVIRDIIHRRIWKDVP